MKKSVVALFIAFTFLICGCLDFPFLRKDSPGETTETEDETQISVPVTETTAVPVPETTPTPTPDPNSVIYGGIMITYDFFEDEYKDAEDDMLLAAGNLQHVTVSIPAYPAAAELINDTLSVIRDENMAMYKETCLGAQDIYDDFGMPGLIGPYEVAASVEPTYITDKLISFSVSVYTYLGGAHGNTTIAAYSFDARTGDYLTFDDLCSDSDAFELFIQTEIIMQIEALPPENRMVFDDYATTVISAFPGAAWLFSDREGDIVLQVTYQAYDIAPYVVGLPTFNIPIDDCLPYFNAYGSTLFQE